MTEFQIKDSGARQTFSSGAVRDTDTGKPSPDLISPFALWRLGHHLEKGAAKYARRNWEAGMEFSRLYRSAKRHMLQWAMCDRSEDHLSALMFNIQAIIHFEELIKIGMAPADLNDMPDYKKKLTFTKKRKTTKT